MYSYTVTIGRNVGSVPMSDELWALAIGFLTSLFDELATIDGGTVETGKGVGIWHGESEENFKVTVLTPYLFDESVVAQVKRKLSGLAGAYRQDAIALTIGQSELIEPYRPACHLGHFADCGV